MLRGVVEPTHRLGDGALHVAQVVRLHTDRAARRADLAQRLALESDGDGAAEARRHRPQRRGGANGDGGGGGGGARARVGGGGGGAGARGAVAHAARGVRLLRDVRPPADGGAAEDAARLRGAAPRDAARGRTALDSAACAAYALAELTGKSPHDAPALVAAAQPLLDRATAELQAVLSRFEPYRGTESFNGFTATSFASSRAATPDAGGGGALLDGSAFASSCRWRSRARTATTRRRRT